MSDVTLLHAARGVLVWLLTYLLHSSILLGAAALLSPRRASSVLRRDLLWKVSLAGGVFTATAQVALRYAPLTGAWNIAAGTATLSRWLAEFGAGAGERGVDAARESPSLLAPLVVGCWLAVAVVGLLRVVRGHVRFRALLNRRPVRDPGLLAELRELQAELSPGRPVRLSVTSWYPSPVALGRGEICVPEWFAGLGGMERRSILAHELAHLARRDPVWQMVGLVLARVFFFQPLNRVALRRMMELAEYACDDWAVRGTGTPLGMLRSLSAVAARASAHPGVGATAMAGAVPPILVRAERLAAGQCETPRRRTAGEVALASLWVAAVALVAPSCSLVTPALAAPSAAGVIPAPPRVIVVRVPRSPGMGVPTGPRSFVYVTRRMGAGPRSEPLSPREAKDNVDFIRGLDGPGAARAEEFARIRATLGGPGVTSIEFRP